MPSKFRPRAAIPLALATALAAAPWVLAAPAAQADPLPPQLVGQSTWNEANPLIGSSIFDPPVVEGGWSAFAPIDDNHYWTVSDRGPNGQPTVNGSVTRTFLTPAFTPTIYKVAVDDNGGLHVQARIPIHLRAGATDPAQAWMAAHPDPAKGIVGGAPNQITGLSQIADTAQADASGLPATNGQYSQSRAADEVPMAADGVTALPSDPYGLDSEGIAIDPRDGSFWLGDEYRPSLVHVAANGTILNRIVPQGVSVAADSADGAKFPAEDDSVVTTQDLLPRAFAYRKQNRGMEGATLTPDGKTLFGMLQSSIEPPAGKGDARTLRIVRFDVSDPSNPRLTGEFAYRLDVPDAGTGLAQTDISISDIYAIDADQLLVDEHDNVTGVAGAGQKKVYEADLLGATNLVNDTADNGEDPQLEASNAVGVVPVRKLPMLDLTAFGYDHDKPEGIGLFPDGDVAVQDDNDFGFEQGNDPENAGPADSPFLVDASGHTTQLWRWHATLPDPQDTDAGTNPGDGDGGNGNGDGGNGDGGNGDGNGHHHGGGGDNGGNGDGGNGDSGNGDGGSHPGHPHKPATQVKLKVRAATRNNLLASGKLRVTVGVQQRTALKIAVRARRGKKTTAVGAAKTTLRKRGSYSLSIKLNGHERKQLQGKRPLTLNVTVHASAAGHTSSTTSASVRFH